MAIIEWIINILGVKIREGRMSLWRLILIINRLEVIIALSCRSWCSRCNISWFITFLMGMLCSLRARMMMLLLILGIRWWSWSIYLFVIEWRGTFLWTILFLFLRFGILSIRDDWLTLGLTIIITNWVMICWNSHISVILRSSISSI